MFEGVSHTNRCQVVSQAAASPITHTNKTGGLKNVLAGMEATHGDQNEHLKKQEETVVLQNNTVVLSTQSSHKKVFRNEARWPPPPCLYLDCEETESEVVSLRWCLPPPDRVPIINCVLEFKDASEQWKPVQGFSFREHVTAFEFQVAAQNENNVGPNAYCSPNSDSTVAAFEFRVAAQNEYGTSPYVYCSPDYHIADEPLLDQDRAVLEHSLEMFSQMTCILKIVIRSRDRSVLHMNAANRITRCLENSEPEIAAIRLHEEICRLTYKKLYFFRKTLIEFDNINLAMLVPFKTINKFATQDAPYNSPTFGSTTSYMEHTSSERGKFLADLFVPDNVKSLDSPSIPQTRCSSHQQPHDVGTSHPRETRKIRATNMNDTSCKVFEPINPTEMVQTKAQQHIPESENTVDSYPVPQTRVDDKLQIPNQMIADVSVSTSGDNTEDHRHKKGKIRKMDITVIRSMPRNEGEMERQVNAQKMPGRNDSQRNKMDKNEATYSLAKTDISHDIEAEDNKDCVARLKQEADGATPQKLKLQWHSEEETDSTNEKSKKKHLILPDDWGGQVKLPLSVSKSGSQDNAKVESHNTSRTDMEEMPGRNDSQRNKIDKNEATYSLAKTDISPNVEAEGDMDCLIKVPQEFDEVITQHLKLQQPQQEECDGTNDHRAVTQAAHSSQVKSPSSEDLTCNSHNQAEVEQQHNIEAEDDNDSFTRVTQEVDGVTPQQLNLQQHPQEECGSTSEKSKPKLLILPDDWGGQVKLPLSVSKSGSQDNAKVESHNTSRTDMEVVAQAAHSSQVKSPSSEILKSDSHNHREVEPQHTSRTDIEDLTRTEKHTSAEPRHKNKHMSKLWCKTCRLQIAKATFRSRAGIYTLGHVGRGFCNYLTNVIMPRDAREMIQTSRTSSEALGHIRDAFEDSECPYIVEEVLKVLRTDQIGKSLHADKIEEIHLEEMDKHNGCNISLSKNYSSFNLQHCMQLEMYCGMNICEWPYSSKSMGTSTNA